MNGSYLESLEKLIQLLGQTQHMKSNTWIRLPLQEMPFVRQKKNIMEI